jgi:hypothetical protein
VLIQAIEWHHDPVQDAKVTMLPALVHIANAICLIAGIGLGWDGLRTQVDPAAIESLRLDGAQIEEVLGRLIESMDDSGALLEMTRTDLTQERKIA